MSIRLSVVIPCYNSGAYLLEAVQSVLAQQGGPALEIIVIDDRSSDPQTLEVLSRLPALSAVIRVLTNAGRKGAAAARNMGVREACGEWVAFLDGDDVWTPGSLQVRWQALQPFPDAQWIAADYLMWHEDGRVETQGYYKTLPIAGQIYAEAFASGQATRLLKPVEAALRVYLVWTSTVLVRRDLLVKVGGFDEHLRQSEDFHLWQLLSTEADLIFVPQAVALYRQHGASLTHADSANVRCRWQMQVFSKLLKDERFSRHWQFIREQLLMFCDEAMYYHRRHGPYLLGVKYALAGLRWDPARGQGWRNLLGALAGR